MDLYCWIFILSVFALQVPLWWVIYLIDKYTWNKGVSRITGEPWKYVKSAAFGCDHKFEAGGHRHTFNFRFDK